MVQSLQILDPSLSNCGTLNEWFQSAKDESVWNERLLALDPPKLTDRTDDSLLNCYPTPERLEDDATSHTMHETVETHVPPFLPELERGFSNRITNANKLSSVSSSTNLGVWALFSIQFAVRWCITSKLGGVTRSPSLLRQSARIRDSESWWYTNHRPPPLVLPHLTADHPSASQTPPLQSYLEYSSSNYNSSCFFL
eukprot:scaffold123373_cov40-Attheya_sp.AAC.3